jgi:hypothetical protein
MRFNLPAMQWFLLSFNFQTPFRANHRRYGNLEGQPEMKSLANSLGDRFFCRCASAAVVPGSVFCRVSGECRNLN